MSELLWIPFPLIGVSLSRLTVVGNGKNAYLELHCDNQRTLQTGVNELAVSATSGVSVQVTGWGDRSLKVDYVVSDLSISGGRIAYTDKDDEWHERFISAVQAWSSPGGDDELRYSVHLELTLTCTPA